MRAVSYFSGLFADPMAIKEMHVFGFKDCLKDKWMKYRKEIEEEEWQHTKKYGLIQLLVDISRIAGYGLGVYYLILLVIEGKLSPGSFGAAIQAILLIQGHFSSVLVQMSSLTNGLVIRVLLMLGCEIAFAGT